MPTLLHIDSSPLYGRSVSRELTGAFVTQWKASHPDGKVIDRDLNATQFRRSMRNGSAPYIHRRRRRLASRRNCFRFRIVARRTGASRRVRLRCADA